MADYEDYYSGAGYDPSSDWWGGGGTQTQEMDPEQFLRQGSGYPANLADINTMAAGGPSGSTNYGMGPDANIGNTPQTVTAMPGAPGAGAGSGGGGGGGGANNRMNLMRMLALAGAGGAGIAGLVTSNSSPTLPKQVNEALKQVNAGGPNDPNAAYRYDLARAQKAKQLSSEMGPGYATSTPGIQAQQELERTINQDQYQRQLGQQQVGLGTINALTGPMMRAQSSNTQNLFGLTGLLGTLGMMSGGNTGRGYQQPTQPTQTSDDSSGSSWWNPASWLS
jgi:hypothetical protein